MNDGNAGVANSLRVVAGSAKIAGTELLTFTIADTNRDVNLGLITTST
jgi:hypothetical protein